MSDRIANMAAIVLCGGRSTRMGFSKAWLPFGAETMLQRVARRLLPVFDAVVVVAAQGQELPSLPDSISVARDEQEDQGPLRGIHSGLRALPAETTAAYVTSCDVPLLQEAFVRRLCLELGSHDIVVPSDGERHHPLSAVYRTSLRPNIAALLAANRLRPFFLFDQVDTARIATDELREVDADLDSLVNLNHPSDYADALRKAGFTMPADVARRLGLG